MSAQLYHIEPSVVGRRTSYIGYADKFRLKNRLPSPLRLCPPGHGEHSRGWSCSYPRSISPNSPFQCWFTWTLSQPPSWVNCRWLPPILSEIGMRRKNRGSRQAQVYRRQYSTLQTALPTFSPSMILVRTNNRPRYGSLHWPFNLSQICIPRQGPRGLKTIPTRDMVDPRWHYSAPQVREH